MKNIKIASLVIGFLLLSACATTSSPKWLTKPYEQHPKEKYLVSVASADNTEDADHRALAGLARNFEVAIKDQTMDFNQAKVMQQDTNRAVTNEVNVTRTINAFTTEVLEGASIDERWKSEQGEHHSLAVLNKREAARRFRGRLQTLDKDTNLLSAKANSAANLVVSLSALERARKLQLDRLQIDRNLSVVARVGVRSRYDEPYFRNRIYKTLSTQRLNVQSENATLTKHLQGAVNQLGAKASQSGAYKLKGVLDLNDVVEQQKWFWLRGSLVLSIEYKGKIIAQKRIPLKQSSKQKEMLTNRMLNSLSKNMAMHLYELLTSADTLK